MSKPQFASALSTELDSAAAEAEVLDTLTTAFEGAEPDLLVVFATHHHGQALEGLGARLRGALGAAQVIGCTAESVIGAGREIEGRAGLSVWGAVLPGTRVTPFRAIAAAGPDGAPVLSGLPEVSDAARASVLLLGDPYTFPADAFLDALGESAPGVPIVGGMASGGSGPGQNLLLTENGLEDGGALGVVLEGEVEIRTVVSQGCRPIGKPWVVTDCDVDRRRGVSLVKKLGGRPTLQVLQETLEGLGPDERELYRRAPFLGIAIDAKKSTFERGDFLVRGLMGQGPDGSFLVGSPVRRGQTVQFLLRDAATAGEDLSQLMREQGGGPLAEGTAPHGAGALLFSCNGRGSHMFDEPDHDVTRVSAGLAAGVPVAGFFAAGEIGPVGGTNFVHGFTASVAVFRPRGA